MSRIRGLGTNFTKVLLNGAQVVTSSTVHQLLNANREVDLNIFRRNCSPN